jgi:rhodanese-related sulfurtransferase
LQETIEKFHKAPESLSSIDRRTLVEKAELGQVIVIDVRPIDEFMAGHLPHARSVPLSELKKIIKNLPKNKEIVAYCRGAYCVLSQNAVIALQKKGYKASRLSVGISEWIAEGVRLVKETPVT